MSKLRAVPRAVRQFPADLWAVVAYVVLTDIVVVLSAGREMLLGSVLGFGFVLFVPGYAFVAALFPESGRRSHTGTDRGSEDVLADPDGTGVTSRLRNRGIDGVERVALSVGSSVATVPLIALLLSAFTPWGIRPVPVVLSTSGLTLVATGIGAVRRWKLPARDRFRIHRERLVPDITGFWTSRTDVALNLLVVLSVLLAAGSVSFALVAGQSGDTEFYLLTENGAGELEAADYTTQFEQGGSAPVVVGIDNREHEPVEYTVVVELQRVRTTGNSTAVTEERELDRFAAGVAHNETWRTTYDVTPTMSGERLRLAFLLYRDGVPANPTIDNAYRELHLWINVSSAG